MLRISFLLLFPCFVLCTAAAVAQGDFTPPAIGQPAEFSKVVGSYTLSASATPTKVFTGEPILLKVEITGSGPKNYEPQRKYLKISRSTMKQNFFVEPLPNQDRYDAKTKTWEFYWLLRPKNTEVMAIPAMRLSYYRYQPGQVGRYQHTYAGSIPVQVKQRPTEIIAPARMYAIARSEEILFSTADQALPWPLLLAGLLLPPLGCVAWYRLWQHLYPDEARQLQRRRSRAARLALKELKRLADSTPPVQIAHVMNRYFRDRLEIRIAEPTTEEMTVHMQHSGCSHDLIERTAAFFWECQEFRYSPPDVPRDKKLRSEAIGLIETLESET